MECEGIITNLQQKGFKIIPPKDLTKEEIILEFLTVLTEENVIGRNILRDYKIRKKYVALKEAGKSSKEAREELTNEKYADKNGNVYMLSEDTIRSILYSEKKRH